MYENNEKCIIAFYILFLEKSSILLAEIKVILNLHRIVSMHDNLNN